MVEFVPYRIEKSVLDLDLMERLKLFTPEEIRAIAKKRKEFDVKLDSVSKCKEDYIKYISFERGILKDLGLRREKLGVKQKKDVIELAIAKRLHQLYKQATVRFSKEALIWISYIKFCKNFGFTESVSQILGDMLKVHSDNPAYWLMAAKWEHEDAGSIKSAQQYLLRGLHFHPLNQSLYLEAFRLALMEAQVTQCPTTQAEVIYKSALKKVDEPEFVIDLLNVVDNFKKAESLQKEIIRDFMERYPREELMWHTMAQRELNGKHFNSWEIKNKKERLQLCVDLYEQAVKILGTSNIWSLYLDAMLEINQDSMTLIPAMFKRNTLMKAMQGAHDAEKMTEKHYLQWLELLESMQNEEKKFEVVEIATHRIPLSSELWQKRLRYHILHNDQSQVKVVFQAAIKALALAPALNSDRVPPALPLWRMMILYNQTQPNSTAEVQDFYSVALFEPEPISKVLKPQYIEWVCLVKGITAARKAYEAIATNPPYCLELHQKMSILESLQYQCAPKYWRRCHVSATEQFGACNTDVWIEYCKFELSHGEAKQLNTVYLQAIERLDPSLKDTFETEFNQLKTGMYDINASNGMKIPDSRF